MTTTKEAQVLEAARDALIAVTSERDEALQKVASYAAKLHGVQQRLECEKLAAQMHEKGLNVEVGFTDLVEDLEKQAAAGKLPVIQEAVEMATPGIKLASINHDEPGQGGTSLEAYLIGNVG